LRTLAQPPDIPTVLVETRKRVSSLSEPQTNHKKSKASYRTYIRGLTLVQNPLKNGCQWTKQAANVMMECPLFVDAVPRISSLPTTQNEVPLWCETRGLDG